MILNKQCEFYGEYEGILNKAMREITQFAVNITNQKKCIEHILCRIKDPESVEGKLKKLGYEYSIENAREVLFDLVGVRLVCNFLSDINLISQAVEEKYNVVTIKDYIKNPKDNGYRSYHILILMDIDGQTVPAEIQVRTISQDSWASLEHKLKYKKNIKNEAFIRSELKRFSYDMASTDLCMQTMKEFIEEQ